MNDLRVFTVSVAFFGIFATFSKFSKTGKNFQKPISVSQQTQDLNVFRSRAVSVAFYSNLLHLPNFKKTEKNSKNPSLFQKNPKLERFEKSYFFRTHSNSNLFPLAIYKFFVFYFWKIHVIVSRKANFARFEKFYYFIRILRENCYFDWFWKNSFFSKNPLFFEEKKRTFQEIVIFAEKSHSTTILLSLAILNNSCFFWKSSSIFPTKINFWTFRDFLLFLSHSTASLINSAQLLNLETIFSKTHLCFEKHQKLKIFEKSYKFSRFLMEACYI